MRDLGLTANRDDPHLGALMDFLDGHPLAMRVMLTQLAEHSAAELGERLRHRLPQTATDDAQAKLFATLSFVEDALPEALKPLLVPLALHERFVDADYLEAMASIADASQNRAAVDHLLNSLEIAGLLHAYGQGIYALHPALTGFLRARSSVSAATGTAWQGAFVEVMGRLADRVAPAPLHVQRPFFALHSSNLHTALAAAEFMDMERHGAALATALAFYAQNQRNLTQAEQWYRKALVIEEKLGNEQSTAATYHQLGRIAQEQHDFAQAEQWYRKALAINEKLGNEQNAALTYHQLGIMAAEQRDFAQAGQWLIRSIIIYCRYDDQHHMPRAAQNFLRCYAQAPPAVQSTLKALWEGAGLGPLPEANTQE